MADTKGGWGRRRRRAPKALLWGVDLRFDVALQTAPLGNRVGEPSWRQCGRLKGAVLSLRPGLSGCAPRWTLVWFFTVELPPQGILKSIHMGMLLRPVARSGVERRGAAWSDASWFKMPGWKGRL